jgi:hypothetical protein
MASFVHSSAPLFVPSARPHSSAHRFPLDSATLQQQHEQRHRVLFHWSLSLAAASAAAISTGERERRDKSGKNKNKTKNPLQISNSANIDHANALTKQSMFLSE